MKNRTLSFLVVPSYIVGVIVGLYLIVIAGWADMESAFYGFSRLAEAGLRGFNCPVLMTSGEEGVISLTVSNSTDNRISPSIRTEISTSLSAEEFLENVELAPGEAKRLEWSVGPRNVDLGGFIFAKALFFSAYPLPNRETTCGVYVIDLPISGKVVLPVLVAISLLGMGWGLYGMNKSFSEWMMKYFRGLVFLAIVVVVGLVVSFVGGWVPSILLLAVSLLLIVILLGTLFLSERKRR